MARIAFIIAMLLALLHATNHRQSGCPRTPINNLFCIK